jgi:pre-mRNA-splicing helicase BRR2
LKLLEAGNIIIATALQWDTLSRRWKQRKIIQTINLYIFDEIHLIGGTGGVTLEVVASRVRYVSSQLGSKVRIILLGSSISNAKDIADWMGVPNHAMYNFSPAVRPIPLELHLHGFETNHFGNRLLSMAKPTFTAIIGHSPEKPAIIFVPSRKQCHLTAIDMITYAAASGQPNRFLHTNTEDIETIKDSALLQTLTHGVGFLHNGLSKGDKNRVLDLFRDGRIQILVCPYDLCWSLATPAHLVVVMETTYYDGREHRFMNYSITDLMQMVGLANRPLIDHSGKAIILCHAPKKDFIKRLINEPLPVESHLDHFLHDHLTAEIVTKTIENKQDAVDYLTWTFYYRRLTQNPNYYNLQGTSHRHLSDHLSELIENTILDLEESKCIAVEDDIDLSPLNLGMIASYYYIQYTTIELFASSITSKTKLKGLMEILSASSEYSQIIMRQSEELALTKLANHLPQGLPPNARFEDPSTKALLLLQAYFCRRPLGTDLTVDLKFILGKSIKLIQALVDVISSQSWLRPALASMELSQMIVQGQWDKDSVLLQIPHFDKEVIRKCTSHDPPIETVFDIIDMEPDDRDRLLDFAPEKMSDIALFCNSYPNVELTYECNFQGTEVTASDTVSIIVTLQREVAEEEVDPSTIGKVICPRFAEEKAEGWWLVVGDTNSNALLSIKRTVIGVKNKVTASLPISSHSLIPSGEIRILSSRRSRRLLPHSLSDER